MAAVGTTTASSFLSTLTANSSSGSKTSTEDLQNRFLTLLVAQLENQDPLNPMDNTEMTSQLSQMSTVTGIEQLNSKLSSLVASLADTQAIQASSLIGKNVLVPGANMVLHEGKAFAGVSLSQPAGDVTVSILDSNGKVVQTQSLGANKAGNLLFSWDGKTSTGADAPDGMYTFKVAAGNNGTAVTVNPLQIGTVSALTRTTGGSFQLDLSALGKFNFNDVQQVF